VLWFVAASLCWLIHWSARDLWTTQTCWACYAHTHTTPLLTYNQCNALKTFTASFVQVDQYAVCICNGMHSMYDAYEQVSNDTMHEQNTCHGMIVHIVNITMLQTSQAVLNSYMCSLTYTDLFAYIYTYTYWYINVLKTTWMLMLHSIAYYHVILSYRPAKDTSHSEAWYMSTWSLYPHAHACLAYAMIKWAGTHALSQNVLNCSRLLFNPYWQCAVAGCTAHESSMQSITHQYTILLTRIQIHGTWNLVQVSRLWWMT